MVVIFFLVWGRLGSFLFRLYCWELIVGRRVVLVERSFLVIGFFVGFYRGVVRFFFVRDIG